MTNLIFALILFSAWYFLYESTIAPSIRLTLRYRLFKLRDQLVHAKIDAGIDFNEVQFMDSYNAINNAINWLNQFSLALVWDIGRELRDNKELKELVNKKIESERHSNFEPLKKISNETSFIMISAFLTNMGAWLPLLLPFIFFMLIKSWLSYQFKKLFYVPESVYQTYQPLNEKNLAF